MKRVFKLLMPLVVLLPVAMRAQYFELGLMLGGTNYLGDLAPRTFTPSAVRLAGGVFGRYNITPAVGVRAWVAQGMLTGSDAKSASPNRRQRNLSFRSPLTEIAVAPEWNILGFSPEGRYWYERFSPYVYGGVGVFRFNPQAKYNGLWYDLQPLGTEGQGMPGRPARYSLTQICIPFGGGVKWALAAEWTLAVELGFRKLFTDYLDDVSTTYVNRNELAAANGQLAALLANREGEFLGTEPVLRPTGAQRGDPADKDWYLLGGVTISYNFLNSYGSFGRRGGRASGCPTW